MCIRCWLLFTVLSNNLLSIECVAFIATPFNKSAESPAIMICLKLLKTYIWIVPVSYIILILTSLAAIFQVFNAFLKKEMKRNTFTPMRFKKKYFFIYSSARWCYLKTTISASILLYFSCSALGMPAICCTILPIKRHL